MEVPACCPHCETPFSWEVNLAVEEEIGWAAPQAPSFLFQCDACQELVRITLSWQLKRGATPRHLELVGGPSPRPPSPQIILADSCPHGCGAPLGLQLDPHDPLLAGQVWPDQALVLGGYRCPGCDGEGVLEVLPVVTPA